MSVFACLILMSAGVMMMLAPLLDDVHERVLDLGRTLRSAWPVRTDDTLTGELAALNEVD